MKQVQIIKSIVYTFQMKLQAVSNSSRGNTIGINSSLLNGATMAMLGDNQVYKIEYLQSLPKNIVQISSHTKFSLFQMEECTLISVNPFKIKPNHNLNEVTIFMSLLKRPSQVLQLLSSELEKQLKEGKIIVNNNVNFSFRFKNIQMEFRPTIDGSAPFGAITDETIINFRKQPHQRIQIIDDSENMTKLFQDYQSKVKNLKVGGLHEQLQRIDRRIFATRMMHPKLQRSLGIKNVKGILLYGPPGTGKTLIARQISKILKVEPKIVNGPQIFNEFVGKSEQKIRELFQDARRDQQQKGSKSQLHCIIFDEIDAICKKRGAQTSNGVYDLIVNQLLTCIDGINSLNNILVIGITNRKDLIDEAILRPGRLQVHIQVNIPDQNGRVQVLQIHTELMKNNNFLDDSVNIKELAKLTKNYTGAELQGVVKSTQSFALQKWKKIPIELQKKDSCKITQQDFIKGISQISPQFGKDNSIMKAIFPKDKLRVERHEQIREKINRAIINLGYGKHIFLVRGQTGVGKTVIAAECAAANECSFTKIINCDRFLGLNEGQIINEIVRIFQDAQRCSSSFILLDDILRLIDFVPLGPRFNSNLLNLLINLIKKVFDPTKKQIILATTTNVKDFEELGLLKYFKHIFNLECLNAGEISFVLNKLGFQNKAAAVISNNIQGSTISDLINTTKIAVKRNEQDWLKCWNQSKRIVN